MLDSSHTFPLNESVRIPALGFGTYLISPEETASAVFQALKAGYRHIDTAAVYGNEKGVGEGIRRGIQELGLARSDIFVTTKLWPGYEAWGEQPKTQALTLAAFDESLSLLGLDYVDLYLIHSPHGGAMRVEQWKGLLALKQQGKARAVGVSNFTRQHLEELVAAGLILPDANQIELHPWSQKVGLIDYMHVKHIAPIAYSSLAPLSTWRAEPGQDSGKPDELRGETDAIKQMAAKYAVSEAQFLLRWGVQNGYAVLPKSLNPERMRQNLDIFGFSIDDADIERIRSMDKGAGIAWPTGSLEI